MDTGTWGLYYNYTWWGNAIQTAPSVIGKPDFFGSQFEMLTSQQPNQVTNGDFATDSDWTKGTGWTISGGKANCNSGLSTELYQSSAVSGKTYKITFTITSYTSGNIAARAGGVVGVVRTSTGTFTDTITANGTQLGVFNSGGFIGSIDNVSVQIVRADNVEAVKCLADWIHETQILDV